MKELSEEELENAITMLKKEKLILVIALILLASISTTIIGTHYFKEVKAYKDWRIAINQALEDRKWKRVEIEMYNSTVAKYIGTKRGSEIKLMIEDIITNNNQNVNEKGRFISIHNGTISDRENKVESKQEGKIFDNEALDKACIEANYDEDKSYGQNTEENINKATDKMREFSKIISSGKKYKVEKAENRNGKIYAVYISAVE